jgi:hypothetical protein
LTQTKNGKQFEPVNEKKINLDGIRLRSSLFASFGGGGVIQLAGGNWAAMAAPVARQFHNCYSELLEPCATESSTLDPIHPKP